MSDESSKLPPNGLSVETNYDKQSMLQESVENLKELPMDKKALFDEASSLGLLPTNPLSLYVPNPDLSKPRVKLIKHINNSRTIGRSINYASILLVGQSGAGKSATINHLLDTKDQFQSEKPKSSSESEARHTQDQITFAETSSSTSKTRRTQEFIIYGDDPQYEVKKLPLGIVDTPGHNDTSGPLQDGCNLLSIKKFFDTHPKLSGHYPNLIFVIAKATDNRLDGDDTGFVKSLRTLNELGLVDRNNPNVLAVLTHVCGVPYKKVKNWSKEMKEKKSIVGNLVLECLKVAAPVVLLENKYGDDDYDLDVSGDFTLLPDGELQPKNLYEACKDILQKNNDGLGLIILNSAFVAPKKEPPKVGHAIQAKNAKLEALDAEEKAYVQSMEKASRGENTDVIDDAVQQFIHEKKVANDKQTELWKIASVLRKFGNPPDLESHSLQNISFFLGGELSSTGRQMLQDKFDLKMEIETNNVSDSARLIGQGYNILNDTSVATQAMEFKVSTTQYGIPIPKCAKFEKVNRTETFMHHFEDDKSYTQMRLRNLGVNLDVKADILKMGCRAGYNKKSDFTSSSSEISILFEQQMFEVKAGNYKEYLKEGTMSFTEDFTTEVEKLPSVYEKTNSDCRNAFEQFFNDFGHFLISSACAGGLVEIKLNSEMVGDSKQKLIEAKAVLTSTIKGLAKVDCEVGGVNSGNHDAQTLLGRSFDRWEGGDANFHTKETFFKREQMQQWKASLLQNPTMLTSTLSLKPISVAVGVVKPEKKNATYNALKDLLGGELEIRVDKEKSIAKESEKKMADANTRAGTTENPKEDDKDGGCFPSSSVAIVCSKDGEIQPKEMTNLEVGDKVMGWDEKRYRAIFTEVIMFGHLALDAKEVEYLKIALEDGNKITLSGNHLVMVGKHKKAVLARKVKPGDILFSVDENREISPKKVLAVEKVVEQGIYCPITVHGNVIVDNVLASCYASVEDHVLLKGLVKISAQSMAHLGLMPMRALHKLRSKWLRKIPNGQTIHPYLQWLCKLNLPWMAN